MVAETGSTVAAAAVISSSRNRGGGGGGGGGGRSGDSGKGLARSQAGSPEPQYPELQALDNLGCSSKAL